jgi:hypothetical protein
VRAAGREPLERDTLYNIVNTFTTNPEPGTNLEPGTRTLEPAAS